MECIKLKVTTAEPIPIGLSFGEPLTLKLEMSGQGGAETYEGPYEVTPKRRDQFLATAKKLMSKDVTVFEIPWWETANPYGKTYVIGE